MTYVFDLDGTIAYWNTCAEDAVPRKERIIKVNRLYEQGHRIIIDTARGSLTGKDHQDQTARQLKDWGVKYHVLRTGVKMHGDIYIDDKGINANDFFK